MERKMRTTSLTAALMVALTATPLPQAWASPAVAVQNQASALTEAEARDIILALAVALEDRFVLPEVGRAYAEMLRSKLNSRAYGRLSNRDDFAKAVTVDLQALHKDGHLSLMPRKVALAPTGQRRQDVKGIAKSGWIAPGVAYIDFRIFNGDDGTLSELSKFLADHANAKTLIIDARKHYGGGLDEMDLLFAAIFEMPTALLVGDLRAAVADTMPGARESQPHFVLLDSPKEVVRHEHRANPPAGGGILSNAKVYLLVSHDTVSAGEHLALALKRTGRATVIGQTTRGAGNFGRPVELPHGFAAFIPFGRTFDPDTGNGWEGAGVQPDISIAPEKALEEALKLAGANMEAITT
jgi:hypothetical protein